MLKTTKTWHLSSQGIVTVQNKLKKTKKNNSQVIAMKTLHQA